MQRAGYTYILHNKLLQIYTGDRTYVKRRAASAHAHIYIIYIYLYMYRCIDRSAYTLCTVATFGIYIRIMVYNSGGSVPSPPPPPRDYNHRKLVNSELLRAGGSGVYVGIYVYSA